MAEITPVTPVVPATPATPGATSAASGTGNAAAGQDFLSQLTGALKTLKGLAGAVTGPPVANPALTDPTTVDVDGSASKDHDTSSASGDTPPGVPDDVMELLASLGLVAVPQPVPPTTDPAATMATPAKGATQAAAAPLSAQVAAELLAGQAPPESASGAQPAAHAPAQDATAQKAAEPPAAAADAKAQTPAQPAVDTPPAPQPAQPQPAPTQSQLLHAATHTPLANGAQADAQQGGMGQDNGQSHDHASKASAVSAAPAAETTSAPPQADLPNALTAMAAPAAPQAAPSVHPAEVVNQIAQQVDLYRLPGNKGVRIQLHPEDLGGVQVTLKYATGGNLELHISVEHAATGELVQAGINQLRDALATQGFQPDRMVMSVSAPSASSQMDFSSNGNGSYRSDTGMNAFMQNGQSGQQRDTSDDNGPTAIGWTSSTDPNSTSEVSSSTSGVSATSRIDYRV